VLLTGSSGWSYKPAIDDGAALGGARSVRFFSGTCLTESFEIVPLGGDTGARSVLSGVSQLSVVLLFDI